MNKTIVGTIIVIVVIAGGIFFFTRGSSAPATVGITPNQGGSTSAPSESTNPGANVGSSSPASGTGSAPAHLTFTLAQVAMHPDRTSCYSAINGNVYDLTSWINQHPGGPQRILSICGKDGSSAFNAQHGGDPRVASILATMKIGTLTQ